MIDNETRTLLARCLATAIAHLNTGNAVKANEWSRELIAQMAQAGILSDPMEGTRN